MSDWGKQLAALHAETTAGAEEPPTWAEVHARARRVVSLLLAVAAVTDEAGSGSDHDLVPPTPPELEAALGAAVSPEVRDDLAQLRLLAVEALMPWVTYARWRVIVEQLEETQGSGDSEDAGIGSARDLGTWASGADEVRSVVGSDREVVEAAADGLSAIDGLLDAATDTSVVLAGIQVARAYLSGGDTERAGAQVRRALGVHTAGRAVATLTGLEGARLAVVLSVAGYGAARDQVVEAVSPSLHRTAALTAVLVALQKAQTSRRAPTAGTLSARSKALEWRASDGEWSCRGHRSISSWRRSCSRCSWSI